MITEINPTMLFTLNQQENISMETTHSYLITISANKLVIQNRWTLKNNSSRTYEDINPKRIQNKLYNKSLHVLNKTIV